jgi:hypothetical protein
MQLADGLNALRIYYGFPIGQVKWNEIRKSRTYIKKGLFRHNFRFEVCRHLATIRSDVRGKYPYTGNALSKSASLGYNL